MRWSKRVICSQFSRMRISVIFLMTLPNGSTSLRSPVMPMTATGAPLNSTGTLMPCLAPLNSCSESIETVLCVLMARRAPSWLVPMRERSVLAMIVPVVSKRFISCWMMSLRFETIVSAICGSRSMRVTRFREPAWF